MRKMLLLVCFFGNGYWCFAQNEQSLNVQGATDSFQTEISGTVLDNKKKSILNAIVTVLQNNESKGSAVVDYSGKYSVKSLALGKYNVLVTFPGYDSMMVTNLILKKEGAVQNFVMSKTRGDVTRCYINISCPTLLDRDNPTKYIWRRDDVSNMPMR